MLMYRLALLPLMHFIETRTTYYWFSDGRNANGNHEWIQKLKHKLQPYGPALDYCNTEFHLIPKKFRAKRYEICSKAKLFKYLKDTESSATLLGQRKSPKRFLQRNFEKFAKHVQKSHIDCLVITCKCSALAGFLSAGCIEKIKQQKMIPKIKCLSHHTAAESVCTSLHLKKIVFKFSTLDFKKMLSWSNW